MKKIMLYILLISIFTVALPYTCVKLAGRKKLVTIYDCQTGKVFTRELEDYVANAVAGEMPSSFSEEALKAQAVASRTFAIKKMRSKADDSHQGASLCTNSAHCQAYATPASAEDGEKFRSATEKTKGKIITYKGEPISALFHSVAHGRTENASDVWGNDVPYLKSVESPKDLQCANLTSKAVFSYGQIESALSVSSPPAPENPVLNDSGSVKEITIGGKTFSAVLLRNILGLKSTCFTVEDDGANLVFIVKGNGHGVGMSQWGAEGMAQNGADYKKILTHYYSHVKISKIR